ncbi:hypothetical protein F4821DRAFT_107515 [Hypoxylon rubiginosum]|uniref:Uncharacterized protein n=1 Tax=Hypoxylon rubiginosum TaxID=110542 RepID=A0ACC0D4F9_9PEZI|nr:hypothetical protein F4821DRAFT_107515 [Hypoxylon rubiginosum]
MSATSSLSAAAATTTSCGAKTYDIPVADIACALPAGGNHTDVLSACCGNADVVSYYDGCGEYCLVVGQTVDDLTKCMFSHGAAYADVFCNTELGNATATATDAALPTSAGASIVATHGSSGATGTSGSSTTSSTSGATDSPGAASGLRPELGSISTLGLTIGALLFSATAFGAFQL